MPSCMIYKLRNRRSVTLSSFLFLASLLSGCGGGRSELGTKVTPCYQALPIAQNGISQRKSFVGVRLVGARRIETLMSVSIPSSDKSICLVAYRIYGGAGTVVGSSGRQFELVAVSSASKRIYGTKVVPKLPMDFRHDLPFS